jgi:putative hydrolase of the HAD superfamily
MFKEIIRLSNLSPENLLVIGDNPASEIAAARQLGIPALLLDRSASEPDFNNHQIASFRDLKIFLQRHST